LKVESLELREEVGEVSGRDILCGDNNDGEEEKDEYDDVGCASLCEGEEVAVKDGCGKEKEWEKDCEVLWEEGDKECQGDAVAHHGSIDDADTGLVAELLNEEVDGSDDENEQGEDICEEVAEGELGVVWPLEVGNLLDVSHELSPCAGDVGDGGIAPVGGKECEEGGNEASEGECAEDGLNKPIDGHKP